MHIRMNYSKENLESALAYVAEIPGMAAVSVQPGLDATDRLQQSFDPVLDVTVGMTLQVRVRLYLRLERDAFEAELARFKELVAALLRAAA